MENKFSLMLQNELNKVLPLKEIEKMEDDEIVNYLNPLLKIFSIKKLYQHWRGIDSSITEHYVRNKFLSKHKFKRNGRGSAPRVSNLPLDDISDVFKESSKLEETINESIQVESNVDDEVKNIVEDNKVNIIEANDMGFTININGSFNKNGFSKYLNLLNTLLEENKKYEISLNIKEK